MTGMAKGMGMVACAAALMLIAGLSVSAGDEDTHFDRSVRILVGDGEEGEVLEGQGHVFVLEHAEGGGSGAWLGVHIEEEVDHREGGARVVNVLPDSPAERAGIQTGDVIVGMGGDAIRGPRGLTERMRDHEPGEQIGVEVIRDGAPLSLDVDLGERPRRMAYSWHSGDGDPSFEFDPDALELHLEQIIPDLEGMDLHLEGLGDRIREMVERFGDSPMEHGENHFFVAPFGRGPKLGVQLSETTPELREHLGGTSDAGVLVGRVFPGTPAEEAGIRVGDLIDTMDGEPIRHAGDLVRGLRDRAGQTFTLGIVRDGSPMQITVHLPEPDREEPARRQVRPTRMEDRA